MQILFLSLVSVLLVLSLVLSQYAVADSGLPSVTIEELCSRSTEYKPPKWEYKKDMLIPVQIGTVQYTASADLQLVSDGQNEWEKYQEELDKFCDWFKETEKDLLDKYQNAQGDSKITAAENLVLFIIEAYKRWDLINQPYSGEWQGEYKTRIYMPPPMLEMEMTEQGSMKFKVSDRFGERGLGNTVEGELKDGKMEATIRMSLGNEPGFIFRSEGKFEIAILGVAFGELAPVMLAEKTLEMEAETNFLGLFGGYVDFVDGKMTTEVYAFDELRTILLGSSETFHDFSYDSYVTFHRSNVEGQLDLTERLNRYFRQYVKTIDDIKQDQFGSQTTPKSRADIAWPTINLLIHAQRLGEMANVDSTVIESTGLTPHVAGSLYDQWYERWFPNALQDWDERVSNASTPDSKSAEAGGRFNFVLGAVTRHRDMSLFSDELLDRLELYEASPLMDRTYKEYFLVTYSLWKSRLQNDPSQLAEAEAWVTAQAEIIPPLISSALSAELGLTTPEILLQALRSAAGESP